METKWFVSIHTALVDFFFSHSLDLPFGDDDVDDDMEKVEQ